MQEHIYIYKDEHSTYEVYKSQNTHIYKACVYMLSLVSMFRSECIDYVEGG